MTEKQRRFADEYLIDLNATRAYRAVYPSVKKDASAAQAASRMLRNIKVSEYIQERMQERQQRTNISQDRVLDDLAAIAFETDREIVSVRERLRALELLCKHLGLFDPRKDELDREGRGRILQSCVRRPCSSKAARRGRLLSDSLS